MERRKKKKMIAKHVLFIYINYDLNWKYIQNKKKRGKKGRVLNIIKSTGTLAFKSLPCPAQCH
jgi:hypothetical protein